MRSELSGFVDRCLMRCSDLGTSLALDVAGGSGRHSLRLATLGATVICADIDIDRLNKFRKTAQPVGRARKLCVQMDARSNLPFRASTFDLVLIVHYCAPGLLAKSIDVLKPGGYLIFETFGAQGGNWKALPRVGQIKSELSSNCDLVSYREHSVRAREGRVTVKAFARKLG
jgi:SAM-dependent methyltransferase